MGPIRPVTRLVTGRCSICNFPLSKGFPEDFPNSWKFCCRCQHIAYLITIEIVKDEIWGLKTVDKIRKKITLVGGNDRN